ncbi:MAG: hypothetical protein IKK20_02515, partial [Clostridia bacterium]|nr:hypothetical protein [Clostridia bacterium]
MSEIKLHKSKNSKLGGLLKFVLVAILGFALLGVGIHTVVSYSKTADVTISVLSTDDGIYTNAVNGGSASINGTNVGAGYVQTLRVGQKVSAKAQANEGYSFSGWWADQNRHTPLSMKAEDVLVIKQDISRIYASFAKNYEIEFEIGDPFNDGQTLSFTETLYVGQNVKVSDMIANNAALGDSAADIAAYYENSIPMAESVSGGFSFSKNKIVVGTSTSKISIEPTAPTLVGLSTDAQGRFEVSCETDLDTIANAVNSSDITYNTATYIVTQSFSVDTCTPIGINGAPFKGIFDGNGNTITIKAMADTSANYVGLFGYNAGVVKNLNVAGENENSITGANYVGGIAGYNTGTITNCQNSATVTATGSYVGGIVGVNNGKLKDAYNTGTVVGSNTTFGLAVGGVVGINLPDADIHNAISTGAISAPNYQWVGGVVGQNYGNLKNSFAHSLTNGVTGAYYVGGVAGQNGGGVINNCYSNMNSIIATDYKGGVTGYNNNGTIAYSYYYASSASYGVGGTTSDTENETTSFSRDSTSDSYTRTDVTTAFNGVLSKNVTLLSHTTNNLLDALNFGQNGLSAEIKGEFYVWGIHSTFNDYPTLFYTSFGTDLGTSWTGFAGGNGASEKTAYLIETQRQLENLASAVNGGDNQENVYYKLMTNITLSGTWTPIGNATMKFAGIFDGQGYTISGIDVSGTTYAGFFGYNIGTIKNTNFIGSVSGGNYVGGVVGYNNGGIIQSVSFQGDVSANGSYIGGIVGVNNGTVDGCQHLGGTVSGTNTTFGLGVGGVVGINLPDATVKNCYSDGLVGTTSLYAVSAPNYQWVGGVVGQNYGNIYNSYNNKNVTGAYYVGGIAGQNGNGTITNTYNNATIAGTNYYGATTGYINGGTVSRHYYVTGNTSSGEAGTSQSDTTLRDTLNGWSEIASYTPW